MPLHLDQLQPIIRELLSDLEQLGVAGLYVFGSTARGEPSPASEVDMLVDFSGPACFNSYMDLLELLERALGCRVDLVTRKALRPELKDRINQEAVRVA